MKKIVRTEHGFLSIDCPDNQRRNFSFFELVCYVFATSYFVAHVVYFITKG